LAPLTHCVSTGCLTQNLDDETIVSGLGIACLGAATTDTEFLRRFDLSAFGIAGAYTVSSIEFGVELDVSGGANGNPITVNVYSIPIGADMLYGNMTALGTGFADLGGTTSGTLVTIPVDGGTVDAATDDLVAEVVSFDHDNTDGVGLFFPGANDAGQTGPSFIAAADCGIFEPTDLATIGFPDSDNIINVNGSEDGGGGGGACDSFTDVTMIDGFAFNWCWDRANVDGAVGPGGADGTTQPPLVCGTDGLVDASLTGTVDGAFESASSTGVVCRSERTTQLEVVNEAPDECTNFSDSFTYDGSRNGNLTYDGDWTSYCFGAPLASGTWSGTFDASGSQAPARQLGVSPMDGANAVKAGGSKPLTRHGHAKSLSAGVPTSFELDQNYPNPFSRSTQISYALPEGTHVALRVYNLLGREVDTLVDGYQEAGRHQITFDGARLSAGVYLYVFEAGDYTATKRLTLLK